MAKIKTMALLVRALLIVQTVSLYKLATAFDGNGDHLSSHRRIQRFFAKGALCPDAISRFIFSLLPHQTNIVLSLDRTNWKFGDTDINVLMLSVTYKGVAFPLIFKMLPKRGNSNQKERIGLVMRFMILFGTGCIDCLVADREFVGPQWIGFLRKNGIRYYVRIRENFWVTDPRSNGRIKASSLFSDLGHGDERVYMRAFILKGERCYLAGARIKNKEGKPELQIIISYDKPEHAVRSYAGRWQVETCFRAMKSAGFNMEDTHLDKIDRIERLVALITIAVTWSYLVGIQKDLDIKPIKILPHGRRAKSLVKYGIEEIAHVLYSDGYESKIDIYNILRKSVTY